MASKKKNNKLLVLDVSALVFRAYHALPPLTTSEGKPAGALYGFLSILLKTIQERSPTHIVAAIDLPGETFRDEVYAEYKATRSETPEDLIPQFPLIYEALEALGIPVLGAEGFEADDVIATVTKQVLAKKSAPEVEIESGDQDVLQLVREGVVVLAPGRKPTDIRVMDSDAVYEKLGVYPDRVTDYKALRGDTSDNIPGVRGIGQKTAAGLLAEASSLKALLVMAKKPKPTTPKLTARFSEKIRNAEKTLLRDKNLVTLRDDVPIKFTLPDAEMKRFPEPAFVALLTKWGFDTLLRRFGAASAEKAPSAKRQGALKFEDEKQSLEDFIRAQEKQVLDEIDKQEKNKVLSKEIANLERSVVPIISAMERYGILVDTKGLATLKETFGRRQKKIAQRIFEAAGKEFNLASPKQLAEVLYDAMGIRSGKKTAKGQRSTAAAVLEDLAEEHEVIRDVLAWREVSKLLSTYVETLPGLVSDDGRIHARFWQLGTSTGRIASSDPNLQNIPTRTEDGKAVRNAFVAPKGSILISADYSQVELRVAAVLAEEDAMLNVFAEGGDIHSATAERVFHVSAQGVTSEMRRRAKILNFGMLYGMGPRAVSKQMGVSYKEGVAFRKGYFEAFPGLAQWMKDVVEKARNDGFTETAFGRRRYLPELDSPNRLVRSQAERAAINAPVQGTATGDLVKMGMVNIVSAKAPTKILVQVHDELLCEAEEQDVEEVTRTLRKEMERVWPKAPVAFPVGIKTGKRWGDMREYGHRGK